MMIDPKGKSEARGISGDQVSQLSSNERRIFELIWRRRPISRTDIARITGTPQMTVSRIVKSLSEKGLIWDSPDRKGERGQPSKPIDVAPGGASTIGVSFSYERAEIVFASLDGVVLATKSHNLAEFTAEGLVAAVADEIEAATEAKLISEARVLGVGVTMPADFVDATSFDFSNKPRFNRFSKGDIHSLFESILELDAVVENDSTAAAIGEMIYGAGQNADSFLFVNIGYGIGAGLILDRRPFRGANGNAGMISVHFPYDSPRPSAEDLMGRLRSEGLELSDYEALSELNATNCPVLMQWVKRAGRQLRENLIFPCRLIDPDALVIGGRLPSHVNQYLASEIDTDEFGESNPYLPTPKIIASVLGPRAIAFGAIALPIYKHLLAPTTD